MGALPAPTSRGDQGPPITNCLGTTSRAPRRRRNPTLESRRRLTRQEVYNKHDERPTLRPLSRASFPAQTYLARAPRDVFDDDEEVGNMIPLIDITMVCSSSHYDSGGPGCARAGGLADLKYAGGRSTNRKHHDQHREKLNRKTCTDSVRIGPAARGRHDKREDAESSRKYRLRSRSLKETTPRRRGHDRVPH